jgi:hypothetical protein
MRPKIARIGLETLEIRALLSTTVVFEDSTPQVVNDKVGTVAVNFSAQNATGDPTPVTVTVATGGGTAVPGVDYTPVQETVTLTPGTASNPPSPFPYAQLTIPILPGPASLGTRVLQVSIAPTPDSPQGQTEDIVITHGTDTTSPYAVSSHALTQGGKVVAFSIQFSKPMAVGPVTDVTNYAAAAPVSRSQIGSLSLSPAYGMFFTNTIPLKSAIYDASANTVYLVPVNPVKPSKISRLAARMHHDFQVGSPPTAGFSNLVDTSGNPITSDSPDDIFASIGYFAKFSTAAPASPSVLSYLFGAATPKGNAKASHKVK